MSGIYNINQVYLNGLRKNTDYDRPIPVAYTVIKNGNPQVERPASLDILTQVPKGVKNIPEITGDKLNKDSTASINDEAKQQELLALLNPPDDKYTNELTPAQASVVTALDQSVNLHLIKQFYESYFSPTALNDAFNRLGSVETEISNVHELLPDGAPTIVGKDAKASWRTNINYAFEVDTGLANAKTVIYNNYAFPPMAPRTPTISYKEKAKAETTQEAYVLEKTNSDGTPNEKTFDLDNITYTGNIATLRRPGFKSINDNINLVQFLMNKGFGIESTYINEWDLSMYMQEGIVDSKEEEDVNHPGTKVMAPVFVTTLTFGLLNDTPIEENLSGDSSKNLTTDMLDKAVTYGSFNMAVSNRLGIDSIATSKGCNKYIYNISAYPLSQYWVPSTAGENLNYETLSKKVQVKGTDGNMYDDIQTTYTDMNVSMYWDELFGFRYTGQAYGEPTWGYGAEAYAGYKKYTPARIFGDNLYTTKEPLEFLIKHEDAREAVLSGWNSTAESGEKINKNDTTNLCKNSNSYAYLPFWKQFFFNPGEGMEDLDQYWQSLYGDGQPQHSILTCADDIIQIITSDNTPFQSFMKQAEDAFDKQPNSDALPSKSNAFNAPMGNDDSGSGSERGNISFSIPIVGKITIPHTKLLNMFLHKSEDEEKAKAKGNKKGNNFLATGMADAANSKTVSSSEKKPGYEIDPNTGEPVLVGDEPSVEVADTEDAIGKKLSYADGVNNFSPFLYGGPHGAFYSPNTLEGYTQANNQLLKTVPTMDLSMIYHGKEMPGNSKLPAATASYVNSKNFKQGSFLNTRIGLSMVERSNILGLRRKMPVPLMTVTFNGGHHYNYMGSSRAAWDFRICFGWGRWKHCWSWSIPKQIVATHYNNWNGWSWPWAWQWWDTRTAWRPVYTTTRVSMDYIMRDFKMPINMTPVHRNWNPNRAQGYNLSGCVAEQARQLNEVVDGENASRDIKFLIYPASYADSGTLDGVRYCPACPAESNDWKNFLYNVWVFSGYGRETVPMSLPIVRYGTNEIISSIVGKVNVERTPVTYVPAIRYVWKPRRGWGHSSYWDRHCGWWFWKHWHWHWWCGYYTYYVLEAEWYLKQTDAYNLYLEPKNITQIIPSKAVVNEMESFQSTNDANRDKTSANIIDRWKVSANTDVSKYYPFSPQFINKYGYNLGHQMGRSGIWDGNANMTLRASAIAFDDVAQNYVNNDCKTIKLRTATGYRFIYTNKYVTWVDHFKYLQLGWYVVGIDTHYANRDAVLTLRSDYMLATSIGKEEYHDWAAFFDQIPITPGVLYNEVSNPVRMSGWSYNGHGSVELVDNSKQRNLMYDISEVYDVYKETCSSQIKWLEEVRDFAKRYLSDAMIYSTYQLVTDPVIQNIITQANNKASDTKTYYTGSYTEDINYFTSLAIMAQKFKAAYENDGDQGYTGFGSLSLDSNSTNSIYKLVSQRISDLKLLKTHCQSLKNEYLRARQNNGADGSSWDALEKFSVFVTDTYGLLNVAQGARAWMIKGNTVFTSDQVYGTCMNKSNLSFNLVDNPSALLWAYANVLYQARKFYINKRLDKVQGSYWILRSMERILTFQAARNEAVKKNEIVEVAESPIAGKNKNKSIAFVESRETQAELSNRDATDLTPTYTKAVYVRVNYIADSKFKESVKYNKAEDTYNNQHYAYVEPVYKTAYKPDNGYYYIMSKSIKDSIVNAFADYNDKKTKLKMNEYVIKMKDMEDINFPITKEEVDHHIEMASNTDEVTAADMHWWESAIGQPLDGVFQDERNSVNQKRIVVWEEDTANPGFVKMDTLQDDLGIVKNRLLNNFYEASNNLINKMLYKVYIDWNTTEEGVGSGIDIGSVKYYIDQKQYEKTLKKERKVTDKDGYTHTTVEPLKSGITFSVADGANIGPVLANYDKVGNFSAKELVCSVIEKRDYWRIEVPEEYEIPTDLLSDTPVLVSDYALQLLRDKASGVVVSPESVIAAISHKQLNPIKHHDSTMITAPTAASLGDIVSINSLGIGGMVAGDVEPDL